MSPLTILIAIFLSLVIIGLLVKKLTTCKNINLPPGNIGWPFLGETMEVLKFARKGTFYIFITDKMARYSPEVFKTSMMGEKIAVICGPLGNKFVYTNKEKLLRSWVPPSISKLLMPGQESTTDDELLRRRRVFMEFIKPDAVHKYVHMMDSVVRQHMDSEWAIKSELKVLPLVKKLVFSLSSQLFMGIHNQTQIAKLENLLKVVHSGYVALPLDFPETTWRRAKNASGLIHGEIGEIVKREKIFMSSEKNENFEKWNLISYLLKTPDSEGKFLNEMEITSIVVGMLIGSNDTVSSLITNLVYFLADHPDVYATALKEQLEIKSSMKDSENALLSFEDTKRMTYGRNVINEVLRLAPTVGNFRETIDDVHYAGFTIPRGWKIFWSAHSTHRDPKYFVDPEKFDPERFDRNTHPPCTFTPFGGGSRMCPGHEFARQAALLFIHHLLINFTYQKLIPTEKIIAEATSVPAKGLPIKLQHCKHSSI